MCMFLELSYQRTKMLRHDLRETRWRCEQRDSLSYAFRHSMFLQDAVAAMGITVVQLEI